MSAVDAIIGPGSPAPADERRGPESTYRLQFHAGFTFRDAAAVVPYLARLGITHVYASPYLRARAGSTHGYDVIDHCSLNPELGTRADFDAFCQALDDHGMSQVLDVVPNHVGIATNENVWWNDVLAHGPESKYGRYFDIAWDGSPRPELRGKVLLPLLGAPYNDVLEKGELKLTHDGEQFWINYHERRLPIAPATIVEPQGNAGDALQRLNGTPGQPRSFDALHALLERQYYRLAYWKNAFDEINYRRFFDVNDLAALSMERQDVFDETHSLIFDLVRQGKVTGLRIDHPDGLYEPAEYFERLQRKFRELTGSDGRLYVVAEKILAIDEPLPAEWAVDGTSGYDFLNMANGLFVDGANEEALTRIYADWLGGEAEPFDELVYRKKKWILENSLASELHMLAHRLDRLAQRYRGWRDFTLQVLTRGLREVIACFGVYRTYIASSRVGQRDVDHVERAVAEAIRRNPKLDASVFHFIRVALLQRYPETFADQDRAAQLEFAGRFQQLTSPTTAKGVEDTAFYLYNRLVSLNEVGGEPSHFGVTPRQVHDYFDQRQRDWPYAMSALSTHDTKRSEDVRARINVLSEVPDEWRRHVERWREINAPHRTETGDGRAPVPNDEYLLYQTLVGAWPIEPTFDRERFTRRIQAYMCKALREGKSRSSWTAPNEPYERGVADFVAAVIHERRGEAFLREFAPFQKRISRVGLINSLAQTLLRLAAPGVPDTYQGTELWDFSLVDPDNRRPVDYARRRSLLEELGRRWGDDRRSLLHDLARNIDDGHIKLHVISRSLNLRRDNPGLLSSGEYVPLNAIGERAGHLFAFMRRLGDRSAIAIVPRLVARLLWDADALPRGEEFWGDAVVQLPANGSGTRWQNELTGEAVKGEGLTIRAADALATFPVALLYSNG